MLTKHDVTIPDAFEVYDEISREFTAEELPYVGFKNVGHDLDTLRDLGRRITGDGRRLVIEIVGASEDSEREAADLAVELGAEVLIGGKNIDVVLPRLTGTSIGYYPTVGDLDTEPGRLHGTVRGIVDQTKQTLAVPGVDGIMLLGYRFVHDVSELLDAISQIQGIRVVNAGSVDSADRIRQLDDHGFWAFTIGSAALDHSLPAGDSLAEQLRWVLTQAIASNVTPD